MACFFSPLRAMLHAVQGIPICAYAKSPLRASSKTTSCVLRLERSKISPDLSSIGSRVLTPLRLSAPVSRPLPANISRTHCSATDLLTSARCDLGVGTACFSPPRSDARRRDTRSASKLRPGGGGRRREPSRAREEPPARQPPPGSEGRWVIGGSQRRESLSLGFRPDST